MTPEDIDTLARLLDTALEMEPSQRNAWIASLDARERALAEPLRGLLVDEQGIAARLPFGALPIVEGHLPVANPGGMVGPYRLLREIGQGGMGSVWLAERSDGSFRRHVALKLPRIAWEANLAGRMARERDIGALLEHPSIARLYDANVDQRGRPYLAFEYIDGQPIDAWCDAHGLDLRQRVALFIQVVEAVAYAHGRLVVHRDLKPSNVMVTTRGQVRLLDFGIAKLLEGDSPAQAGATREGVLSLTPEYAAPEQFSGGVVSVATDVYGLGVLLYQLLANAHPSGLSRASLVEYARAATEGRFVPPSVRAPAHRRLLRGDLDTILAKALQPLPQDRYATAAALAEDLAHFLRHEPISARPDSFAYRAGKFVRRNRLATALATLALVAMVAGVTGTVLQARRAEQASVEAASERDSALRQLHYAEASNEFVSFLISEVGAKSFTTADLMARAEGLLAKQFGRDPGVRARLLDLIATRYGNIEQTDRAKVLYEQARQSAIEAGEPLVRADIDCQMGLLLADQDQSQWPRSRAFFADALATYRGNPKGSPKDYASCLGMLSKAESEAFGDPASGLEHAQEGLDLIHGMPGVGPEFLIDAHEALGGARAMLGQLAPAVAEFEEIIDLYGQVGRERSSDMVTTRQNLGVFLSKGGQTLRAITVYREALETARAIGGADASQPTVEINYAKALADAGLAADALPIFRQALATASKRGNRSTLALTEQMAGYTYCRAGQLSPCADLLARARIDLTASRPAADTTFGTQSLREAQLAALRGQTTAARQHFEQAVAIYSAAKERNPIAIHALATLARIEQGQGLAREADQHLGQALDWAQAASSGFKTSAWLGVAQLARAAVLLDRQDRAGAAAALKVALPNLVASLGDAAPETLDARRIERELAGGASP